MLHDLIDERRILRLGGQLYRMRRIPLSAIVRLMDKFGAKLPEMVAAGALADGEKVLERFTVADMAEMFSWVLEPSDLREILGALTQPGEGPEVAGMLTATLVSMNNLPLIFDSLGFGKPIAGSGDGQFAEAQIKPKSGASNLELIVEGIARRYGRPPHEIMEWPYEEILRIAGLVNEQAEAVPGDTADLPSGTNSRLEAARTPAWILNSMGEVH